MKNPRLELQAKLRKTCVFYFIINFLKESEEQFSFVILRLLWGTILLFDLQNVRVFTIVT